MGSQDQSTTDNMLLLLTLISSATAAPQWLVNPQFSPYGFLPYSLQNAPSGDLPAQGRLLTTSSTGTLDTSTICGSGGATACTATGTARFDQFPSGAAKLATVTSPFFMINGFHVSGISTSFIAKGTVTGKTEVSGMYIAVYNDADTLIGCTNAAMS